MKVAVGADHAGYLLKERVKHYLESHGHTVLDMGTSSTESTDYPQYAFKVAEAVRDGVADRGVLVCDTGNGIAIAANKVEGIRAALVIDPKHAEMSRRHNDANVLVLGSAILPEALEVPTLDTWFSARFDGGRHARRIAQILAYERTHERR
ncbi:MAG: ribose 5-phosphate isomerase B [Candidatus Eisenbacteria bacterium]|uniref:Ribose 5-phosphate isomerase B n=1 Tax=Eiseniibacteriota bacterium TaxID=2212470 RepID=A0A538TJN9_UNCEI|nr:MAG: ribose 5-phosphate isomerase B [Candidatus Eisenbacteria bacterium]